MMDIIITTCSKRHRNDWHGVETGREPMSDGSIYEQTLDTIGSINALNIKDKSIHLIDNSLVPMPSKRIEELIEMGVSYHSYPTTLSGCINKGLHEIELISKFIDGHLFCGPILKISARYVMDSAELLGEPYPQLRGKLIRRRLGFSEISTAAYVVGDSETYKVLLDEAKRQTYLSIYRFYTPFLMRRFFMTCQKVLRQKTLSPFRDPEISIEEGFYRAAKRLSFTFEHIPVLGIHGILASEGVLISQ